MSITTKAAGVQAADAAISSFHRQRAALCVERDETSLSLVRVRAQLQHAVDELAAVLLPNAACTGAHLANLDQCLPGMALGAERVAKEQQRVEFERRLGEIDRDHDYTNRQALLSDYDGELGHGLYALRALCAEGQDRRDSMDGCKTFTFALNRHLQKEGGLTAFQSFWRSVTLSPLREKSARKSSCEKFGHADWESLLAEYDGLYERLAVDVPRLAQVEERRQRLDRIGREREEAHGWTFHFEEQLSTHLREVFRERVMTTGLSALCARVRGKAVVMVGRLDALRAKVSYLGALEAYLEAQAIDRQARSAKLTFVRGRWARSYGQLRADKTKWLVTVPAIKAESCDKCCRWGRRLYLNIEDYVDYESYASYLAGIPGMLPYDAFAYGSNEAMPYEGFVRQVIPALDRHRTATGQAKADYAPFKARDKERGAKTRDPREEAGNYDNPDGGLEAPLDSEVDYDPFESDSAVSGAAYYATASTIDYGDYS